MQSNYPEPKLPYKNCCSRPIMKAAVAEPAKSS